ncbi:MAG: ComF family protein [Candidatus Paceibacterota bacterium]
MRHRITLLLKTILDIIFPQAGIERDIANTSPETLIKKLSLDTHEKVHFLFRYKDPLIKQMIWRLKYKKDTHVAHLFAVLLHDTLLEELSDTQLFSGDTETVIVPIPLSKRRARERGYNQMKLVTNELLALGGCAVDVDLLVKKRHTKPQTSLTHKSERVHNIKEAFAVTSKKDLKNTRILLLDDVLTTGSTLAEAKKTLLQAGARSVSCIALAH